VNGARVEVEGLDFAYGPDGPPVLRELSLAVPAGSTTALLGRNGAGKTTLLYLLLGWRRAQRGRIEVDGREPAGEGRRRAATALVPQDEHVPFDFSLLEYVLLGRAPHLAVLRAPGAADIGVARLAIAEVGLAGLEARPVPELSGGQRQLAMIARALAQEPRLLLLDEPFSHLDLGNAARIAGILRRFAAAGLTILFTTHDPNVVLELADRVALLADGRLLGEGPTREILTAENLRATYGVAVELLEVAGRPVVLPPPAAGAGPRLP